MYTLKIKYDECAESPREWDNLSTIILHSRADLVADKVYADSPEEAYQHILDDAGIDGDQYDDLEDAAEHVAVILPVYMYKHGGVALSTTPFSCPWDSGQAGFIYILRDKIEHKTSIDPEDMLRSELEVYNWYVQGYVYGFELIDEDGDVCDSCSGFYPMPNDEFEPNWIAIAEHIDCAKVSRVIKPNGDESEYEAGEFNEWIKEIEQEAYPVAQDR